MAKARKSKAYRDLRQSLLDDLESRGLVQDVYTDMVDQYMDLWERRQELKKDIAENGVSLMDPKRGMRVENRSVTLESQVVTQMLRLFKALGFQDMATAAKPGGGDDEL